MMGTATPTGPAPSRLRQTGLVALVREALVGDAGRPHQASPGRRRTCWSRYSFLIVSATHRVASRARLPGTLLVT